MITLKTSIYTAACAALISGGVIFPAQAVISAGPAPAGFYFGAIPSGSLSVNISDYSSLISTEGTHSYDDGYGTTYSAILKGTPSPNLDFHATDSGYVDKLVAGAAIRYFYTITGGTANQTLKGTITTSMSASGTGNYRAIAVLGGTDFPLVPFLGKYVPSSMDAACAESSLSICINGYDSSFTNRVLNVNFSRSGEIDLIVGARIKGTGSASVFLDPTIHLLDPTLTLTFSDGVGNAAPVQEPDTYALMIAGLGVVGFMARRNAKS